MVNKSSGIFLLTTKFYKSANGAAILDPDKGNPEGEAYVKPEGTNINKK